MNKGNNPRKNNAWSNGSFYLVSIIIIGGLIILVSFFVPLFILPIAIISGILILSVIGALQLRNDDLLKEETFLKLMIEVFKRLPLLKNQNKQVNK